MSKIQILKANHNSSARKKYTLPLFINVKDTNFESKSQRALAERKLSFGCLSMSKIQILKANHNYLSAVFLGFQLFINVKDTNFESKSQQLRYQSFILSCCLSMSKIQILKANHNLSVRCLLLFLLFINVKDTNFESKSQLLMSNSGFTPVVYQCQRYKF